MEPSFKTYQQQIVKNAAALAEGLIKNGLRLVSGGTDNHLILVDLRPFKVTGKIAETVLDEVGITINKNTIPFDPEKPSITSGIRIGTPALTTRGMKEAEMKVIADLIAKVLKNYDDEKNKREAAEAIEALSQKFPLYHD
jgi:glycine hydroxymethyltransferase